MLLHVHSISRATEERFLLKRFSEICTNSRLKHDNDRLFLSTLRWLQRPRRVTMCQTRHCRRSASRRLRPLIWTVIVYVLLFHRGHPEIHKRLQNERGPGNCLADTESTNGSLSAEIGKSNNPGEKLLPTTGDDQQSSIYVLVLKIGAIWPLVWQVKGSDQMLKWESCLLVADGRSVQPGQSVCDSDWTRNRGWCKSVSVCEWTESSLEGIRIRRATRTCRRGSEKKEDQKEKSTRKRGEKFMQQRYQKSKS